jgi:hypothetical protein
MGRPRVRHETGACRAESGAGGRAGGGRAVRAVAGGAARRARPARSAAPSPPPPPPGGGAPARSSGARAAAASASSPSGSAKVEMAPRVWKSQAAAADGPACACGSGDTCSASSSRAGTPAERGAAVGAGDIEPCAEPRAIRASLRARRGQPRRPGRAREDDSGHRIKTLARRGAARRGWLCAQVRSWTGGARALGLLNGVHRFERRVVVLVQPAGRARTWRRRHARGAALREEPPQLPAAQHLEEEGRDVSD